MGKKDADVSMDDGEDEPVVVLSPIANPLAKDKLVKKILKLVKAGERVCFVAVMGCERTVLVCPEGLSSDSWAALLCSLKGQDSEERSQRGGQGRAKRREGRLRHCRRHIPH
jgi:hypothetical protein